MRSTMFKVAAVQASPVYLDLEKTVEKACRLIFEAGQQGAKVVGFPESFLPGFPHWIFKLGPMGKGAELYARLFDNAVVLGDRHLAALGNAAKQAGIHACVSGTEREGGSLCLSQFWFGPDGDLIGHHRKLKPTGPERYIWGNGSGHLMPVMASDMGNLGGLLCWEHLIPLTSAAMCSLGEEIHVGSWPGSAFLRGGPHDGVRSRWEAMNAPCPPEANPAPSSEIISRNYAMATQTIVLMSTNVLARDVVETLAPLIPAEEFRIGGGHARIIAPDGMVIGDRLPHDKEGLVYANVSLEMITMAKYMCDPAGHYGVPDILSLNFTPTTGQVMHRAAAAPAARTDDVQTGEGGRSGS